jgi:hypothetical protein
LTTIVEYKGWGLDEEMGYIHLNCGRVEFSVQCDICKVIFPDEQWYYLSRIKKFLLP